MYKRTHHSAVELERERESEREPSQCTKLANSNKPWARPQRKRPSLGLAKAIILQQGQGEGIRSAWTMKS